MADDVLLNKGASIERCVAGAREEYAAASPNFATDFTRQDAAVLNIQRACEAALDMGQHLIRREKLGLPQSARDVFDLLAQAGWIELPLADALKKVIGCLSHARGGTRSGCAARAGRPWAVLLSAA